MPLQQIEVQLSQPATRFVAKLREAPGGFHDIGEDQRQVAFEAVCHLL